MEIIVYILIGLIVGGVLVYLFKPKSSTDETGLELLRKIENLFKEQERFEKVLKDEMMINRSEVSNTQKNAREELSSSLKLFGDSLATKVSDLTQTTEKKLDKVNTTVENKLTILQEDNSKKLEKMRETVDEKLQSTLEKRFGDSFKLVSDQLDRVQKGLGEMQTIAVGVGDLKKILSNVKTRGTWGEAQLGNLLEEILTPDQYEKNVRTKKGSKDNVEYAIKLPGSEDEKNIWLPIDAKFPMEDYQKLIEAQDKGDILLMDELGKALENRIKAEAKDIKDKYLDPPHTTDFGILFVPIESLYAEILRRPGFVELIRRDFKVVIYGPTTIQMVLNGLRMGFRTLVIQKRSSEVWTVLSAVKSEFGKFGGLLEKTHKKIQEAGNVIEDAITKTGTIEKKLNKVQELPSTKPSNSNLLPEHTGE
ncbi:MAG: DNA recombination protein RmuC [Candidatus Paceibacterota bacterium]|jgi:DNA recombination protein RmuC